MRFDINHMVKVRLTPFGRAQLAADYATFCAKNNISRPYVPPAEDAEGWSTWQLWRLMFALGQHFGNGVDAPFETEIEIIESEQQ